MKWFKPGWIVLALVVAAFAYLCLTVLAPWQLGKNTKTSRENDQIAASLQADPVPVMQYLPKQDSAAPDEQWRRVTATGRYLSDKQILARLRVVDGKAAFEVLTPFQVQDGPVVLVNRGYIHPEQGVELPPVDPAPTGTVSITARLRDSENAPPDKEPIMVDGRPQVYAIDTRQLSELLEVPLTGSYLQLTADQPGLINEVPLPHLDAGPFLSYGIQWIAFGILAPIGLGYFLYSEIRARRRAQQEEAERDTEAPQTVEQKLADRYGRRR